MAAALLSELLDERLGESGGLGVAAAEVREVDDEVRLAAGEQRQQRVWRTAEVERSVCGELAHTRELVLGDEGGEGAEDAVLRAVGMELAVARDDAQQHRRRVADAAAGAARAAELLQERPPASTSGTASDARTTASNAPRAGRWAAGGSDGSSATARAPPPPPPAGGGETAR